MVKIIRVLLHVSPKIIHTYFFVSRRFTPKTELSICGHATLAASHILFASDQLNSCTQLMFRSEFCGDMCATKSTDGSVQFSFSGDTLVPVNLHEDDQRALSSALSISYSDIVFIGRTVSDLLIELTRQSFSRVAQVVDYAQLAKLAGRGVIITCKGKRRVAADEKDTYYCVSCGGHPYMNDPTFDYLLRAFYPKYDLMRL